MEYPKTENLYASNGAQDATRRSGPEFGFRQEAVGQISTWLVTEKVDGMNMRVVFYPYGCNDSIDEPQLFIYGRTEKAQIPGDLMAHMQEKFTREALFSAFDLPSAVFRTEEDETYIVDDEEQTQAAYDFLYRNTEKGYAHEYKIVLFGEGFGPGIQGGAGAAYGGTKRFAMFDVVVNETWLRWADVLDVAVKLNVATVPVLGSGLTLEQAKGLVGGSFLQPAGSEHIEGIVVRTDPYLFDGRGKRVMFKYKLRDL